MDTNGLPLEGFPFVDVTAGLGFAPFTAEPGQVPAGALMDDGLPETDSLSETEKEHIILECKDADSGREVDRILERRVPEGEMGRFLDSTTNDIL